MMCVQSTGHTLDELPNLLPFHEDSGLGSCVGTTQRPSLRALQHRSTLHGIALLFPNNSSLALKKRKLQSFSPPHHLPQDTRAKSAADRLTRLVLRGKMAIQGLIPEPRRTFTLLRGSVSDTHLDQPPERSALPSRITNRRRSLPQWAGTLTAICSTASRGLPPRTGPLRPPGSASWHRSPPPSTPTASSYPSSFVMWSLTSLTFPPPRWLISVPALVAAGSLSSFPTPWARASGAWGLPHGHGCSPEPKSTGQVGHVDTIEYINDPVLSVYKIRERREGKKHAQIPTKIVDSRSDGQPLLDIYFQGIMLDSMKRTENSSEYFPNWQPKRVAPLVTAKLVKLWTSNALQGRSTGNT